MVTCRNVFFVCFISILFCNLFAYAGRGYKACQLGTGNCGDSYVCMAIHNGEEKLHILKITFFNDLCNCFCGKDKRYFYDLHMDPGFSENDQRCVEKSVNKIAKICLHEFDDIQKNLSIFKIFNCFNKKKSKKYKKYDNQRAFCENIKRNKKFKCTAEKILKKFDELMAYCES
ncbi:hypothetical protein ACFLYA_01760 [Candidatus Dependentiae bacterium]